MSRTRRIFKAFRLMHINNLLKIPVKKDIINVDLLNVPPLGDSNGEIDSNRGRLNNRVEGLKEVDIRGLLKPLGNKVGLIFVQGAINLEFCTKNPLSVNHILCSRGRD